MVWHLPEAAAFQKQTQDVSVAVLPSLTTAEEAGRCLSEENRKQGNRWTARQIDRQTARQKKLQLTGMLERAF